MVAKGVTGKVEVSRDGKVASTMDVEWAAELTIVENTNAGPRVGAWVPFSPYSVAAPGAVSGRLRVLEPANEDGLW